MIRFLQGFFGHDRPRDDTAFDAALHDSLQSLHTTDPETQAQWLRLQRALTPQTAETRRVQLRPRLAFGLAVVAVAVAGAYVYLAPQSPGRDTFVTERGQQTRLVLQDSSEVTLNYATELVVRRLRPGKPRLLSLNGEAYFRVRHNETPFIVSTECADVRVVGTEFNVRSRDGMLEVAVARGTVMVTASRDGKDSSLTLAQNDMAVCSHNDFPRRIGTIPSPEYPGWMNGKLVFNRTSFADACRELEMRFAIAITIDDHHVRGEVVTGVLSAANSDSAVAALCSLAGKKFRFDGKEYLIY